MKRRGKDRGKGRGIENNKYICGQTIPGFRSHEKRTINPDIIVLKSDKRPENGYISINFAANQCLE